ncbi:uncharacterized protein KY384_004601 [Bacidia gigantensis]|uniref:uncharacterized protein n=1 Tax=Bacidia gigantensis TaxID=2732470 RepID=UPI001D046844|nr:uncharacterized protein KY384_004601 [Bacidia gigantensis]KAG8531243.1 hypothetical protein KY384_004601 [Bacidia gigantensis]
MDNIKADSKALARILKAEKKECKCSDSPTHDWTENFYTRIKFAFSESRLEQRYIVLRDLVADVKAYCLPHPLTEGSVGKVRGSTLGTHLNKIQDLRNTGEASQGVYSALTKACDKHIKHQAHFCVEVQTPDAASFEVEFTLAFTSGNTHHLPQWIVIRTALNNLVRPGEAAFQCSEINGNQKRRLGNTGDESDPESQRKKKKKGKQVRLRLGTAAACSNCTLPVPIGQKTYEIIAKGNLCDLMRSWHQSSDDVSSTTFVLADICGQKTFLNPGKPPSHHRSLKPMSLREVIALIAQGDHRRLFTVNQRLKLARTISLAFLRYYPTSWGHACWESNNISFFDVNETTPEQPIQLTSPHLQTTICESDAVSKPDLGSTPELSGVRNSSLFKLALLYLEIAYSQSWETLIRDNYSRHNPHGDYTEYDLAMRLAKGTDSGMPVRFHKIIEQLIACDFAQGFDLVSEDLQAAVHRDVTSQLEELEESLRRLDLDE